MKSLMLTALLFFAFQAAQAQQALINKRNAGESLQQFASRIISRGDQLNHVVEGNFGASRDNVVIFFDHDDEDGTFLHGWVLVPENGKYRKYELDVDGFSRFSTVKAIFFMNADSDAEKELIVLTSAPSELLIEGKRVDVCTPYIFDWAGNGFTYLQTMSENLTLQSDKCTASQARRLIGVVNSKPR